mgnify:CR=1 FL=1
MYFLDALADGAVDHGNHQDDGEEDQSGGRSYTVVRIGQHLVDVADHGIEGLTAHGLHIVTEDTDDAGILLEAADETGDDNIGQHGAQQRHGDAGKDSDLGGGVDLGCIVVLLVDALQTAQQHQDLKGQRVPDDVDHHHDDVGPVVRAGIDPVDGIAAEEHDDVVDDAFDRVKNTLIKMISDNPADGEYYVDLLMIAKYFERIGDHAVNIAEWVEFSVTGVHEGD